MSVKRFGALVLALGLLGTLPATAVAAGSSYWNVAGTYDVNIVFNGDTYPETLVLTQAGTGTITGTSLGAPCSPSCAEFTIGSGSVVGDSISFGTTTPFIITFTGPIAADGSMSGSWEDGVGGLGRTGTWSTTLGLATFHDVSSHAQSELVPYPGGATVGGVVFNSSAGSPNNFEMTLMLKKVSPYTAYDVWLFLDTFASGQGTVVGTFTTNGIGNGTLHVNLAVAPGIHTVAVDVTLHGSGNDVFVTPGLYGQNLFMYFR